MSLKYVKDILQWNLVQLYLTLKKSKKYLNRLTDPLSSADISIFSPEISNFCYIMKYRYRLRFYTYSLILLIFFESLKIALINMVAILIDVTKIDYPRP